MLWWDWGGHAEAGSKDAHKSSIIIVRIARTRFINIKGTTYLSFAVGPEIDHHGDHVVDGRVGGLVDKGGGQGAQREDGEAELEGAVERGAGEEVQRPFEGEHEDAQDEVDDLEYGDGLDTAIEGLGEEVPEDLGPEKTFNRGSNLVCVEG
jgi:hypothetical protein